MGKFYNNVKTVFLLGLMTGLIMLVGGAIGGQSGLIIAFVFAGAMNMGAWFFSDRIALASMGAQEVGPDHELYRITADLVQRANMPMPKVYVSPQQAPNAFATGRSPSKAAVCATEGLLQVLSRREVAGVMAHELAHVKHRDTLISAVAATIAGAISMLAQSFFFFGAMGGSSDDEEGGSPLGLIGGLLMLILAPIAAMIIQMAISRSREFNADTEGAAICGDPADLASALVKVHNYAARVPMDVNPAFNNLMIVEPFSASKAIGSLFSTHPPLEKRLENLVGASAAANLGYAA